MRWLVRHDRLNICIFLPCRADCNGIDGNWWYFLWFVVVSIANYSKAAGVANSTCWTWATFDGFGGVWMFIDGILSGEYQSDAVSGMAKLQAFCLYHLQLIKSAASYFLILRSFGWLLSEQCHQCCFLFLEATWKPQHRVLYQHVILDLVSDLLQ